MNPATLDDFEARYWRALTAREQGAVLALLDDAYLLLLQHRPLLADDVEAGLVNEDAVIRVLCAMVARVLDNPEGSTAVDDYGYGQAVTRFGALALLPEEFLSLAPVTSGGAGGAFSISLLASE